MPLKPPRTRLLGVSVVALTSAAAMLIAAPAAQAVSPDVVIAEVYGGGGNAGSPADGGEPGGNIRVAFMFRTDRGLAFVDRPGGTATATTTVTNAGGGQPQLSFSPGRVAPTNSAWSSSRKPLVGEFTRNGQKVFAIANTSTPRVATTQHPSKRWQGGKARLAQLHARVGHLRCDGLHKLTTRLTRTYGTIVVEDLNVAGMLANRRLARAIADAGFGQIRHQLTYKSSWYSGHLVVADRWFASSKTCSSCGVMKTRLRLRDRTFHCDSCGLIIDRDLNKMHSLCNGVLGCRWRHLRTADASGRVHRRLRPAVRARRRRAPPLPGSGSSVACS